MTARDREATERRIFEAASAEFAEHGLAGARIDAIARRAKANKQLIYAYFESKERLFAEVVGRQLDELSDAVRIDPDDVPGWAARLYDFHAEHPDLARLRLHEALHYGAGPVPNEARRQSSNSAMVEAVEAGQRRGTIDPALDPRDVVMLAIGLASWHASVPQLARMVEGEDRDDPTSHARRRAAVAEAVRRIVAP
jgi:AcrR family transcriptional regulator